MVVSFKFMFNLNIILFCIFSWEFYLFGKCYFVFWLICFIFLFVLDFLFFKCVKIVFINIFLDDFIRVVENYGVLVDRKKVVFVDILVIFRVYRGFMEENGIVFLEVFNYLWFFLCYKNYYFYLEKEVNSFMFCKCLLFGC